MLGLYQSWGVLSIDLFFSKHMDNVDTIDDVDTFDIVNSADDVDTFDTIKTTDSIETIGSIDAIDSIKISSSIVETINSFKLVGKNRSMDMYEVGSVYEKKKSPDMRICLQY